MRRVVTHEVGGRSRVLSDADARDLWETAADAPLGREPTGGFAVLEPPAGGTRFRMVSLPPDAVMREALAKNATPGIDHDGFHKTATIDYVLVLDGDVTLELDEESVVLHSGDCVVQRNTNHAWRNHGDKPIRLLAVMVGLDR